MWLHLAEMGSSVLDPYEEEDGDCLYCGTVSAGNAGEDERKHFVGSIRIMGENKLRIALYLGEVMFARRTLMQLATKLAIGLGALFLVGVLLAAIPNHREPVVVGVSADPGQEAQGMDHASLPDKVIDRAKSNEKGAVRDMAQIQHRDPAGKNVTAPKTGDSTW